MFRSFSHDHLPGDLSPPQLSFRLELASQEGLRYTPKVRAETPGSLRDDRLQNLLESVEHCEESLLFSYPAVPRASKDVPRASKEAFSGWIHQMFQHGAWGLSSASNLVPRNVLGRVKLMEASLSVAVLSACNTVQL